MFKPFDIPIDGGLDVPLPRMFELQQVFERKKLDDIPGAVAAELQRPEIAGRIKPGMSIAIGVGSRGVANIAAAVKQLVTEVKALGGEPFIFPAMGSHGSASAAGQTQVLADYGVDEAGVGAPVRATMDTKIVAEMDDGTPVHVDRYASEADGIILVNRIKPHTTFRGEIESGIVKMAVIGMGKIAGATAIHTHGMDHFPVILPKVAALSIANTNFLFGLGLVENAYDETAIIEALTAEALFDREAILQAESKRLLGRLFFDEIDVLIIDRMGKEISGAGFDPNVTGRNTRGVEGFDHPKVSKVVVLDLTEQTHGNASGVGAADVITRRLFERIDFPATYANIITSAYLDGGAIPLVMNNERDAIQVAVKTVPRVKPEDTKIVRIRDTLTLGSIQASEPLFELAKEHANLEPITEPEHWRFDNEGNLVS
ncbi:MAG: hypothetical protein AAF493_16155 [Pseudomonadota bacterium]